MRVWSPKIRIFLLIGIFFLSISSTYAAEKSNEDIVPRLKVLGYPERTCPDIERELKTFLEKIDFPSLKIKAKEAEKTPAGLKNFVSELDASFRQAGTANSQHPHPLIKILVNSLGNEDILAVIEASPVSQEKKEEAKVSMFECSAVSQLGFIVLDMLGINSKVAYAPEHIFNIIPSDWPQALFVDFWNELFMIVDVEAFYRMEGKFWVLKEEYRLDPGKAEERKRERQGKGISREEALKEILNDLYFYLSIPDSGAATASIYYNRGTIYGNRGDFEQAISHYSKAIKTNPNYAEAYYNRGLAYDNQDNLPQAISDYTKAIEINPNYAKAYYNRGFDYNSQGNYPQAISDYSKAIEINPNDARVYNNRGVTYGNQHNFSQAISDFTKAIEIDPNRAMAYGGRGVAYLNQNNLSQAISDFTKAIEIDPNYALVYYNRGLTYDSQGNYPQAISDYTKAIEINPNYTTVYYNRGLAYYNQSNYPQAISDYTKAIEINPNLAEAYYNRGLAYYSAGNFSQVIPDCTKAIEIDPNYAMAYYNRGLAYYMLKEYDKSWADVHKAEELGYAVDPNFITQLKEASGRD